LNELFLVDIAVLIKIHILVQLFDSNFLSLEVTRNFDNLILNLLRKSLQILLQHSISHLFTLSSLLAIIALVVCFLLIHVLLELVKIHCTL
jgi:hypothetical protein